MLPLATFTQICTQHTAWPSTIRHLANPDATASHNECMTFHRHKHVPEKWNFHQTEDWDFSAWSWTANSASHQAAGKFSPRDCRSWKEAVASVLWSRKQGAFPTPAHIPQRTKAGQYCPQGSQSHSCLQETCTVLGWWFLQGMLQLHSGEKKSKANYIKDIRCS